MSPPDPPNQPPSNTSSTPPQPSVPNFYNVADDANPDGGTILKIKQDGGKQIGDGQNARIINNIMLADPSANPIDGWQASKAYPVVQAGDRLEHLHKPKSIAHDVVVHYQVVDPDGNRHIIRKDEVDPTPVSVEAPPTPTPTPNPTVQQQVTQAIQTNLPEHLQFYQNTPSTSFTEALIPDRMKNFKKAATSGVDPHDVIAHQIQQVAEMQTFADEVTHRLYKNAPGGQLPQDPRDRQKYIQNTINQTAHDFRNTYPLAAAAFNKDALKQAEATLNSQLPQTGQEVPALKQEIETSLDRITYDIGTSALKEQHVINLSPEERSNLADKIVAELDHHTYHYQGYTAQEVIRESLEEYIAQNKFDQVHANEWDGLAESLDQISQKVGPAAQNYQDLLTAKQPRPTPQYTSSDPYFAFGLKSPLFKSGNRLSREATGSTYKRINKKLGDLSSQTGLNLDELKNTLNSSTLSLYRQGYTSADLDRLVKQLQDTPFGLGAKNTDPHLQELIQLRDKLGAAEQIFANNPDLVHNGIRGQRNFWHRPQRFIGRLTNPFGIRTKYSYGMAKIRGRIDNIGWLHPTRYIFKPINAVGNFTAKYNPFIFAHKKIDIAKRRFRRFAGNQLTKLGAKVTTRFGKRLAGKVAGKLLTKAGAAVVGGAVSGGIGTAIMVLSIAKDIWDLTKEKLKPILALAAAIAYSLIISLIAFIKSVATVLAFAAMGASIGALLGFGIPGAIVGGIVGGIIGYALPYIAGIKASIGSAITSLSSSIPGAVSAVLGGATKGAVTATTVAVVGAGVYTIGSSMYYNTLAEELFTYRTDGGGEAGLQENPYIGVEKTADPTKVDVPDGETITYVYSITPKLGPLTDVSITDEAFYYQESGTTPVDIDTPDPPSTIDALWTSDPFTFDLTPEMTDAVLTNTITITATDPDGNTQTATAIATVIIGNPPTGCFVFANPPGPPTDPPTTTIPWPVSVLAQETAAAATIVGSFSDPSKLCVMPINVWLATSGLTVNYGGWFINPGQILIDFKNGSVGSNSNALYTLAHETGHHYATVVGMHGFENAGLVYWNGSSCVGDIYPFSASKASAAGCYSENFAEGFANYIRKSGPQGWNGWFAANVFN